MKKYLVYFLILCMTFSTVLGLAKVDFTFKQTVPYDISSGTCYGEGDYIWCFALDGVYRYTPDTDVFELITSEVQLNTPNYGWGCWYDEINTRFVCTGNGNGGADQIAYHPDTNTTEAIALDFQPNSQTGCAVRPSPDYNEVYCWQGIDNPSLRKYDINTDTTTVLRAELTYPNFTQENVYLWGWGGMCSFRNNDEFWCFGGYNDWEGKHFPNYMRYIISTDTAIIGDLPESLAFGQCRWYDDVAYCYGYENDYMNEPYGTDKIMYIDPDTGSSGFLWYTVDLPYLWASEYGSSATMLNVNKDFIIGGWSLPSYDPTYDIYEVKFEPCNEHWVEYTDQKNCTVHLYEDTEHCLTYDNVPPQNGTSCEKGYVKKHSTNDITGLAIDIPVEIGASAVPLAGVVAIVGVAGWLIALI
jgi:hypothetical protein